MSDFEGHGWGIYSDGRRESGLHVGRLPNRKQIALYEQSGVNVRALAYFPKEWQAAVALRLLDAIAEGRAREIAKETA